MGCGASTSKPAEAPASDSADAADSAKPTSDPPAPAPAPSPAPAPAPVSAETPVPSSQQVSWEKISGSNMGLAVLTHASFEGEYFYATLFEEGDGRKVAQWMKGGEPKEDAQAGWTIKDMEDGTVIITHAHFRKGSNGNYLYATNKDDGEGRRHVYAWCDRGTARDDPAAKWIIKKVDDGSFVIISAQFPDNYLYAATFDDGEGRRAIYCWMKGGAPEADPQAKWKFVELPSGWNPPAPGS